MYRGEKGLTFDLKNIYRFFLGRHGMVPGQTANCNTEMPIFELEDFLFFKSSDFFFSI